MIGSISLTQAQSMISASVNWAKDNNQHIAVAVVDRRSLAGGSRLPRPKPIVPRCLPGLPAKGYRYSEVPVLLWKMRYIFT